MAKWSKVSHQDVALKHTRKVAPKGVEKDEELVHSLFAEITVCYVLTGLDSPEKRAEYVVYGPLGQRQTAAVSL
jgi:hypothetical protein